MVESSKIVVSDTGPLISLEKLSSGFSLLNHFYHTILIPHTVLIELTEDYGISREDYFEKHQLKKFVEVRKVPTIAKIYEIERLDRGEQEAISMAHNLGLPLLIEETLGRKIAIAAGIHVSGIAGQVLRGWRESILSSSDALILLKELHIAGRINNVIFEKMRRKVADL